MAENKDYEVTVYHAASRKMKVRARDREEAIEKASRRAKKVLGLEVTMLRVPFLEGDE